MTDQNLSSTDINRFLNEEVSPILTRAINVRSVERQFLRCVTRPISGQYFLEKAKTKGNFRFSGRPERGKIPGFNPDQNRQDRFAPLGSEQRKFKRRFCYTAVDVTGPMRQAPKTDSGGFENIASMVIEDTVENLPESISRKLAGTQAQVLGQIDNISGNEIRLVPANNPASPATAYPWAGNRYFREGMVLDAVSGSAPYNALRTGTGDRSRQVTGVSTDGATAATCTITMDNIATANGGAANAWAAGDLLIEADTRQDGAIDTQSEFDDGLYDMLGIMDGIQNGSDPVFSATYYASLIVAGNRTQQSISLNLAAMTQLTVDHVNRLLEQMMYDPVSGGSIENHVLYATPSVHRHMAKQYTVTANQNSRGLAQETPIRYMNPGKGRLNVGISGLEIVPMGAKGSKVIYVSPFAPHYRLYAIEKSLFTMYQENEPGFMNADGLTLRNKEGEDVWNTVWHWYASGPGTKLPRGHGYITGLQGDMHN